MKNMKGLTLIEVIISIALISLIAVTFLGMFNMGSKNIFRSGKRTKSILQLRELIDDKIRVYENKVGGEYKIQMTIPGVTINKIVKGTMIMESDPDNPDIKITTFVPNQR